MLDTLCITILTKKELLSLKPRRKMESKMDRGKQCKTSTHAEEVKQLLKPLNSQTGLYGKTGSPKDCTGHGMHMCISQIITYKMMIRCETMCNSIKMPDPKQGFECSFDLLLFSGQEIHF